MRKILIIRFSSIGDIIQCMSITKGIKHSWPDAEIHWITRKDMSAMLHTDPHIDKIIEFNKKDGISGIIKLALKLRKEKYDYIYDAHLNVRSKIVKLILSPNPLTFLNLGPKCITRKKNRIRRVLFFTFNMRSLIKLPFRGMLSFQQPLSKWGIKFNNNLSKKWRFPAETIDKIENNLLSNFLADKSPFITVIPSAAWPLKRWPVSHWMKLIALLPQYKFIILAGPDDAFCWEIEGIAPDRTLNLAGQTSLMDSFYIVSRSQYVISADTGFLHAADLFGINSIALMGPTAFGHPSGDSVKVLEIDLPCRPCTKEGNRDCKLIEDRKCLVDISPEMVINSLKSFRYRAI